MLLKESKAILSIVRESWNDIKFEIRALIAVFTAIFAFNRQSKHRLTRYEQNRVIKIMLNLIQH